MSRRLPVAVLAAALLLGGCSDIDTSPDKPTLGGGDSSVDVDAAALADEVEAAGLRDCPDTTGVQPATGDGALPDLDLACLGTGAAVNLGGLRGPAVLNLWASWCKPCREELPLLARLDEELGDQVAVIGLDVRDGDPSAAIELAAGSGVRYPQLVDPDGAVSAPFAVQGLPQTVFVDAQGRMVASERVPYTEYADLLDDVSEHLEVGP